MISFALYMFLTVSYFLHLTARVPALGAIRFDLILIIAVLVMPFLEKKGLAKSLEQSRTAKILVAFIVFTVLTIPIVEWPGSVLNQGLMEFIKVVVFFFATLFVVDTRRKLKAFILFFLFCQFFRVLEPAYLHYTSGYWGDVAFSSVGQELQMLDRLSGAPYDVINPNQLAWVAVGLVPFMYYFARNGGLGVKAAILGSLPAIGYAFVFTGSRSGLLSLMVVLLAVVFIGKGKMKRAALIVAVLMPVFFYSTGRMGDDLKERYLSLVDESVAGHDTAKGRIEGVKKSFTTFLNRPIAGHGLGTSKEVSANLLSGRAQISHNLYIEVLQEVGIAGFIIFMMFIGAIIGELRKAKVALSAAKQNDKFLIAVSNAALAWCVMDLFYSLSCFGLNSWEWYLFGGIATVTRSLAMAQHAAAELEEKAVRTVAITGTV